MIAILISSMVYSLFSSFLYTLVYGIFPLIGHLFRPDVLIYIASDLFRGLLDLWNDSGISDVFEHIGLTELWEQCTDYCEYYGLISLWTQLSYFWAQYGLTAIWSQIELLWNSVGLWNTLLWIQNRVLDLFAEYGIYGSQNSLLSIWDYLTSAVTFCDDSFHGFIKYLVKVIRKSVIANWTSYSFPSLWYSGFYGTFNGLNSDFYSVVYGMPIPTAD